MSRIPSLFLLIALNSGYSATQAPDWVGEENSQRLLRILPAMEKAGKERPWRLVYVDAGLIRFWPAHLKPVRPYILDFEDPLNESARKQVDKLRNNARLQIDRCHFISGPYAVDKVPAKITLPADSHTLAAVHVLYEDSTDKVPQTGDLGTSLAVSVDKSKKGPVRLLLYVFPLDKVGNDKLDGNDFMDSIRNEL